MAVTINGSGQVIVQIAQAIKTDTSSTTSTTYSDVSGLSVSITPTSSSNRILVLLNVTGGNNNGGGAIQLLRDSTVIAVGTAATGNQINVTLGNYFDNGDVNSMRGYGISYIDSPSTTSAITYKAQFRVGQSGGGYTMNVNRPNGGDNASYNMRAISTITVMEISG